MKIISTNRHIQNIAGQLFKICQKNKDCVFICYEKDREQILRYAKETKTEINPPIAINEIDDLKENIKKNYNTLIVYNGDYILTQYCYDNFKTSLHAKIKNVLGELLWLIELKLNYWLS